MGSVSPCYREQIREPITLAELSSSVGLLFTVLIAGGGRAFGSASANRSKSRALPD